MSSLDVIEDNPFYKFLREECKDDIVKWKEPRWRICIPVEETLKDATFNRQFAESHVLMESTNAGEFMSLGCGRSRVYHLVEDALLCHQDKHNSNQSGDCSTLTQVMVSKITILSEHFITVQSNLVHLLLISDTLDPTPFEEDAVFETLPTVDAINSLQFADNFLREFSCHVPIIDKLQSSLNAWQVEKGATEPLLEIQSDLHNKVLETWDTLIRRHSTFYQTSKHFQDLLFRALDYLVVGWCHSVIWWRVRERCGSMDDLVTIRLKHLRAACFTPLQMELPALASIAAPAAVVELAALGNVDTPIGRLHCFHDALELLQAHAKQARAEVHTYTGADCSREALSEEELLGLLVMAIIEAQCHHLVSNLYYTSHYVFSLPDNHPVRLSGSVVKNALQKIMQLDLNKIVLTPCKPPLRKEVSLLDLMKIASAVEQRFERPRSSGRDTGTSTPDISSYDLHMQELTQRIQRSTMESSSIDSSPAVADYSSPRSSTPSSGGLPHYSLFPSTSSKTTTTPTRSNSFMEFISSLPSSIRRSFRKKQTEQRKAVDTEKMSDGEICRDATEKISDAIDGELQSDDHFSNTSSRNPCENTERPDSHNTSRSHVTFEGASHSNDNGERCENVNPNASHSEHTSYGGNITNIDLYLVDSGHSDQDINNAGDNDQNITNTGHNDQNITNTGHCDLNITNTGHCDQNITNTGHCDQNITNTGHCDQNITNTGHCDQNIANTGHTLELQEETSGS